MGGGHVPFAGQAVGVPEGGLGHAKRLGGAVHPAGKTLLRAADGFADGGGAIIGGFHRGGADQIAHGDGLARPQAEFRGRLVGGVGGHFHLGIQRNLTFADRLERDVKGEHLGEGGGVKPGIGVGGIEDFAGAGIHDHGGIGRGAARGGEERQNDGKIDCQSAHALPQTVFHVDFPFPASRPDFFGGAYRSPES